MPIPYIKYGPPTAYSYSEQIKDFGDGSVLLRVRRWNCWGEPRDGPGAYYDVRVGGEQIRIGWHDFRTLDMLKNGCCPEFMMADILGAEGTPD